MIKFMMGIYIFGIFCRSQAMYNIYKLNKICIKATRNKYIVISWVISIIIWPLYWLRDFINYYLDWDPEDFKK